LKPDLSIGEITFISGFVETDGLQSHRCLHWQSILLV